MKRLHIHKYRFIEKRLVVAINKGRSRMYRERWKCRCGKEKTIETYQFDEGMILSNAIKTLFG